jgi:hypothetical protein
LIEKVVDDNRRAVSIRRRFFEPQLPKKGAMDQLPYADYDYDKVIGFAYF